MPTPQCARASYTTRHRAEGSALHREQLVRRRAWTAARHKGGSHARDRPHMQGAPSWPPRRPSRDEGRSDFTSAHGRTSAALPASGDQPRPPGLVPSSHVVTDDHGCCSRRRSGRAFLAKTYGCRDPTAISIQLAASAALVRSVDARWPAVVALRARSWTSERFLGLWGRVLDLQRRPLWTWRGVA